MATQVTQRSHARAHARTLATVGPRPTTDQAGGVNPKKGQDNNVLYIGGGLAAVAAIWYYYASKENERINKEQELGHLKSTASAEGGRGQIIQDATRSVKERTQDVKAEAQSKVQAARDQVGQTVEWGKQRFEEGKDQASHRAAEAQSTVGEFKNPLGRARRADLSRIPRAKG